MPDGRVVLGHQPCCPGCDRGGREVGDYENRVFECATSTDGDACPVMTFVGPAGESAEDGIPTTPAHTSVCPDCGTHSEGLDLGGPGDAGMYVCVSDDCRVEIHGRSSAAAGG